MLARVTEILKPLSNYSHIDPAVLEAAANRGTRVHLFCEAIAKNAFIPDIPEDILGYVKAYEEWFQLAVDEIISLEIRLDDIELGFTGQIDMVARLKGDSTLSLIDIKTSAQEQKSWCAQLAAYSHLLKKSQVDVSRRLVLKLSKTGTYSIIEYQNDEHDWNVFVACVVIYRFLQ